jgi:hypothetical protein
MLFHINTVPVTISCAEGVRYSSPARQRGTTLLPCVQVSFGSSENALEPRMRRIVFSIAFFRQKLPVQLVSASTKSRRKFYTQVQC